MWLQQRLYDGTSHWYDVVAALVYVTHFVTIPLLTAVVWFCLRDRFAGWLVAVLTMSVVGIGVVERISHIGWEHIHLDAVARLTETGQPGSNPVAAMPSLHAGAALLVALFIWPSVGALARAALAAYAVAMALTLVYTGEHYVADVAAGWLVAVGAIVAARWSLSRRWRSRGVGPGRPGAGRTG